MAIGKKSRQLAHILTIKSIAALGLACILAACGDDGENSLKTNDDDGREVATLAEMGRCTSEREGDTVYVAEKMTDYLCKNKTWVDLGEVSDGETAQYSSSATEEMSSTKSEAISSSSSSNETDSAQGFIRENISVTGAAQKGPFKFGSPLELRELRLHNDSLVYSGLKYIDEVSSNKGDFVIPKVSLVYPYAELTVRGLWRNEVSGEWSKDTMTLQSLTDLSERTEANVNLLTHLEYDRAKVLVNKGYSVSAAKKQADYEIMTAFGFATTIKFSEDLSIFDDRDDNLWYDAANATLLAMSVLFMGDRNDSEIREAIEAFRLDVAEDGEWNDEKTKAEMADWALEFDNSKVRANVKSWNILEIPAYEEYMKIFWNNAYGLGGCASTRYGVVSPNTNKLSKNYAVHYICEAAGWRKATDYEKDTYGWDKGEEGEVKKGGVTATYYVFDNGRWIVAENETALGLCIGSRNGEIGKIDSTYYVCKEKEWMLASVLEYDTYQFSKGNDGEVRPGKVNADSFYVYENGKWRAAASEIENDLGACVASREGVVDKSGNIYYICKSKAWKTATALEYDTYGWKAGAEGDVKVGSVNADKYYVYENGTWRGSVSEVENNLGACVTSREGEIGKSGNTYYICKSKAWTTATALEYDTYGWDAGTEGEVKAGSVNTSNYYIYKERKWQTASDVEKNLGGCTISREGEVGKSGNTYYICKSKAWTTATALEYDTYGWDAGTEGEVMAGSVNTSNYYIFKDGEWQTASAIEKDLGGCILTREGEVGKSGNTYYICKSKAWTTATVLEYDTYGWDAGTEGEVKAGSVNTSNYYIYKERKWQTASDVEKNLGGCTISREGEVGKSGNTYYICKSKTWATASALEYDTYGWDAGTEGEVKPGSVNASNYYIYKEGKWRTASSVEKDLGGCLTSREGEVGKSGNTYYICKSKDWTTASTLEYDTFGKTCLTDGSVVNGEVVTSNKYVCDAGLFRIASDLEISLDKGCVSYTEGIKIRKSLSASLDSVYLCNNCLWNVTIEVVYGILTDSRDGQTYKTVTIGTQTWMAENLNYAYTGVPFKCDDGGDVYISDSTSWCYNNNPANCVIYGRLYTWATAMDSVGTWSTDGEGCGFGKSCSPTYPVRGICPEGWHLPTPTEWNTLFAVVGDSSTAGKMLKSISGWNDYEGEGGNGKDAYAFSALPAGLRYPIGSLRYSYEGDYAYFWSSTEYNRYNVYRMYLRYDGDLASLPRGDKSQGLSVRCVKD